MSIRNILIASIAVFVAPLALGLTTTNAKAHLPGQTAPISEKSHVQQPGMLVIRNGSDFATLSVTVYRLESDTQTSIKQATIVAESSQIYSLPVGDYRVTFEVDNGTAALSEARFTIEELTEYTINFHTKPKGKPTD